MTGRSILLLIDIEPDPRKTRGNSEEWEGSQRALPHLEALRREFEKRTRSRVSFNWFIRADPQIQKSYGRADWFTEACPQLVRTIKENDDECGIHPHLWRWDTRRAEWFNEFNDPHWTAECLHISIQAFEEAFGRSPDLCRFGDRWLNQNAVELMRASGIRYDLTIEPGLPDEPVFDDPDATGRLPDYRESPRAPYHPSKENFLVPETGEVNDSSLWIVPLTTTAPIWRLKRRPPYLIKASRPPNLALSSSYIWPHLQEELKLKTKVPLVVVVRTGDFTKSRCLQNFSQTTQELVKHPALKDCEFTHPADAVTKWQAS
jgi:hypothetical protein